jgi:hypothetical protein
MFDIHRTTEVPVTAASNTAAARDDRLLAASIARYILDLARA